MKIINIIILLFIISLVNSQSPLNWDWAEGSHGSAYVYGTGVAADSSGNIFVTGYFGEGMIIFGTDTLYHPYLTGYNFFIVKYNPSGNVLWAKAANMPDTGSSESWSVATDASGNAYITGEYYGNSVTLGDSVLPNTAFDNYNSFIAKYDAAGNVLWAKASIASPGESNNFGYSIAVDGSGNSYSAGSFSGAYINFAGNTIYNNNNSYPYSLYIVKYNRAGTVLWAKSTNGLDEALGIAVDGKNNAYITGIFSADSVSFDNITLFNNPADRSNENYFIAKYDSSGNAVWAKGAIGNRVCVGYDLATDKNNNIYVTGYLTDTFNFGGAVVLSNLPNGFNSSFIVKYNVSGNIIWGKASGGNSSPVGISIAAVAGNNIYASGSCNSGDSMSFDSTVLMVPDATPNPLYIYTFDSSGDIVCASWLSSGGYVSKFGFGADKNRNGYIACNFNTSPFILGADTLHLSGTVGEVEDFFVAKFMCPNCANSDTFTYQLTPAVLCVGDSAQISFSNYTGISITPVNEVRWIDSLHAVLKPNSTTTYTIKGYLPCGIQYSQAFTLQVVTGTLAITSNAAAICSGGSVQICAAAGYSSYNWSNGGAGACIEVENTGTYSVTATENSGGCTAHSSPLSINVDQPHVVIGAVHDTICAGDSTLVCANGNFSIYSWSPASGGANTRCIETENPGTYSLMVTDSNGCTAQSNSVHISAGQAPSVIIGAVQDSICAGDSTLVCANGNFSSYTWSAAAGGAGTQCIEAKNAGLYTLTVTNNQGCTAQSNHLTIYAGQLPTVTVSANKDSICPGDSAQLCATGNFSQYIWSNHAQTLCMETSTPGTYYLRAAGNNGCSVQSNSVVINARQAPIVTISAAPDTICGGDSARICANGNFGSYSWSPASGGAATQCIETQNTGNYSLMVTNVEGCTAQSNSVTIYGGQVATANITANHDTICPGDSAQLCATGNFLHFMWSPAYNGEQTLCIETQAPGTYYLLASNGNGCGGVQSNSVIISAGQASTPTLTANADSICNGDSTQICVQQGFATYTWNPAIGGTTANCIQVQSPGAYSVAVTDNSGCTAQSNPLRITVLSPQVTVATSADSICTGDSAQLCSTPGFVLYFWSPPFGGQGACIETSNTGAYNVTVTDNNGCTAQSNAVNITVGQLLSVNIGAYPDTICSGDSAEICAGANYSSYTWSNSTSTQCIETKNAGNYSVLVTDNAGCTGQSNIVGITVMQMPTVTINATADSICPNDSAKLCATQGFAAYTWSSPFGGQGACIEVRSTGNYNVTVSDNFGCTAQSNVISIAVRQSPIAHIETNTDTICPGDSAQICSTTTDSIYNWSVGLSTKCIAAENAGDYYVTVTDNKGCTAESNHVGITTLSSPQVSISENGDTLIANNAIGCQWYFNDAIIQGATRNTYVARISGTYTVSVTDSDGCSGFSSPIVFTGVADIAEEGNISVYPNPTNSSWQMAVSDNFIGAQVEVLAADGRVVYKLEIKNSHTEIEAPFAGGVYLLRVISGTSIVGRKLVKL